jgi:(S)-mandelate dehydrogenase
VLRSPINAAEYRELARRRLPRAVFDFIEGGAEDEFCLRRNRVSFSQWCLVPRIFRDVSQRDCSATIFGRQLDAPIAIAPTGLNGMHRADGDLILARAAAKANIPFILSTPAGNSIEQVAEQAGGNLWFQLYFLNRKVAFHLLDRARTANYKVLVLTLDTPVSGRRERDLRNKLEVSHRGVKLGWAAALRRPQWFWDQLKRTRIRNSFANLPDPDSPFYKDMAAALALRQLDASVTWDDLKRVRDRWPDRLMVKAAMGIDDLKRCEHIGVDGVVLSNHGGRQLDSAPTPLEMLSIYRAETRMPLFVDGGVRRGADVVKALALGAGLVLIGRVFLYALAVAGETGVTHMIEILKAEIDNTLALVGCSSINGLDQTYLFQSGQVAAGKIA